MKLHSFGGQKKYRTANESDIDGCIHMKCWKINKSTYVNNKAVHGIFEVTENLSCQTICYTG